MAVIRPAGLPGSGFVLIANSWVRDPAMTLQARGLLVYLLSHAEGYKISNAQQVRECANGRDAVTSAREELVRLGYLTVVEARDTAGRFAENDYTVTDPTATGIPQADTPPPAGNPPSTGNPSTGKPSTVGPPHRRTTGGDQGTTSRAASGDTAAGAQLELVDGDAPTPGQRAHRIATTYADECGGMVRFMAVRNVVALAVKARPPSAPDGYPDERILAALRALRGRGRSITAEALHDELEGVRRSSNGHAPHRDAPGTNYAATF